MEPEASDVSIAVMADGVPPLIAGGAFDAFFIYDVADSIDVARLLTLGRSDAVQAQLHLRRAASSEFIQFPNPPILVQIDEREDVSLRAKVFDYGVVSIRIRRHFKGAWEAFAELGRQQRSDTSLTTQAQAALNSLLTEIASCIIEPHPPRLEEYYIFYVDQFETPTTAGELMDRYSSALAQLILGEDRQLMRSEQDEALRVNFEYYEDELTVVHWETAFIYDRPESARAIEDILEFANTQLVELRTYDAVLDNELDAIYALEPGRPTRRFFRGRAERSAAQLRYLIVDVLELTDRVSNALKIIGDAYYARLYRGAAGRLGLADWRSQIDAKLNSVKDMYRFFQDQAQHARDELLEVVIIILILVEVLIGFLALRH